tara:strand:- start:1764 stop:2114 length:351 start_codon:yes stop_codon:yes gene_type:complete
MQPKHHKKWHLLKGKLAESWTSIILTFKGYRVLCRNYKSYYGEIDIIAVRANTLCAIEVKYRKSSENFLEAVSPQQQARILNSLQFFANQSRLRHHPTQLIIAYVSQYGKIKFSKW